MFEASRITASGQKRQRLKEKRTGDSFYCDLFSTAVVCGVVVAVVGVAVVDAVVVE